MIESSLTRGNDRTLSPSAIVLTTGPTGGYDVCGAVASGAAAAVGDGLTSTVDGDGAAVPVGLPLDGLAGVAGDKQPASPPASTTMNSKRRMIDLE